MSKRIIRTMVAAASMLVAASPALAHDHTGMQQSMEHAAAVDEQSEKESVALLDRCMQQVASIHRSISKLQATLDPKHTSNSANEELKKLELKLQEANDIVRPLQIF